MKICWCGWLGPFLFEWSFGLYKLDPNALCYITGELTFPSWFSLWPNGIQRQKLFTSYPEFFSDLQDFDVIICDAYPHGPNTPDHGKGTYTPNYSFIFNQPEWKQLKSFKLLIQAESVQPGLKAWYEKIAQSFDGSLSFNPASPNAFIHQQGIPTEQFFDPGYERDIDVLFSGNYIDHDYRNQLAKAIQGPWHWEVHHVLQTPFLDWRDKLQRTKFYVATQSQVTGKQFPYSFKEKTPKALLCGALPLTEEFAALDPYLAPGRHRITFRNPTELSRTIPFLLTEDTQRKQIVKEGKIRVKKELDCSNVLRKTFVHYGIA